MKFSSAAVFTALLAILPSQVSAHGFLSEIIIDGKKYSGNDPVSGKSVASPIRKISTPNPNYGANNPALNCGPNAKPGALVADAMPGSKLQFNWAAYPEWPHNTGPVLTYLASCGSTSCDKFDSTQAKWFKIHQDGRKSNGQWVQQDIMNGGLVSATLPKNLAAGNYLVRHEIIALHLATQKGKAEFYPSCTQIKVGGSESGAPKASELVSFPGAYSDSDPGIFVPQVFNTNADYKFPGPAVVTSLDVSSGSADSAPAAPAKSPAAAVASDPNGGSSTGAAASKPAKAPSTKGSTKSCRRRLSRREPEPVMVRSPEVVPQAPVANETAVHEKRDFLIRGLHFKRFGHASH